MSKIRPKPENVSLPEDKTWEELTSYQRYYYENKEKEKNRAKDRKKYLVQWLQEYKEGLSCPCGEDRVPALDFHHRDGEEKTMRISKMPRSGYSKDVILEEINKCDVICSNCHRVKHSNHM